MTRTLTLVLLLSAAAACGGKDTAAPAAPAPATEHAHDGHGGGHHGDLSPEMNAFHDVLAPRWHAQVGPERIADTCGALAQFKSTAATVATSTPPLSTNADTWTTGTRALVAAVDELEAACTANDTGNFEAAFEKVHEAFHALMQQAGAHGGGDQSGQGGMQGPGHDASGGHEHHH